MGRTALPLLDARAVLGRIVAPVLGMAFFWAYFRYQIVFMVLYPQSSTVPLGPATIPAHGAFLLVLAIAACAALALHHQMGRAMQKHPGLWAVAMAIGTVGSILALTALRATGDAHAALAWLSAPLVACGFLAAFLGWGLVLSRDFGTPQLVVLSASYFLSLVAFRPGTPLAIELCPLLVPLGCALFWFASMRWGRPASAQAPAADAGEPPRNPSLWLFAAFLLAGSVVRGIVDNTAGAYPDPRRALSMPITGLLVIACCAYWFATRRKKKADPLPFVLGCWIGFAALFFCGIFMFVAVGSSSLGGSLVVIARSMLEVALWMFLCDCASRRPALVVPLFIVGGVFVETASWAVSYVAVPALLPLTGEGAGSQTLALIAVFGLVAVITAACGVLLVLQSSLRPVAEKPSEPLAAPEPPQAAETEDARASRHLEDDRGLTAREATVALLYARGYSLAKVAEELGVTTSSAQTSIKSVYRKLDVHSKNELIGVVEGLREG